MESNKYDVCIVTGWSDLGGSTESFVNLTNALNSRGISTVMVGPQEHHTDRCNGLTFKDFTDIRSIKNLIWHFLPYREAVAEKYKIENVILSCHEMGLNRSYEKYKPYIDHGTFNHFHFVSEHQKDYHVNSGTLSADSNISIIPNIIDPKLVEGYKGCSVTSGKVGGVIGSIDRNKRVHLSIQRALDCGCDGVKLFGKITDHQYFHEYVERLMDDPRVVWHGPVADKCAMYSSVTDVYHYSSSETWGYIRAECETIGVNFHHSDPNPIIVENVDDILSSWAKVVK